MGTKLFRASGLPEGISDWTARLVPGALILLFLWPSAARSMSQAEYRGRPDSRSATIDWFLENVPSGTHIAFESYSVEFSVAGAPSRSHEKVFFSNSIRKRSLKGLARRGFEFIVVDSRSENGFFHINRGERKVFEAKLEPVLKLLNEDGYQGPDRYIFRLPRAIKNPMHIFLGEPTPGRFAFQPASATTANYFSWVRSRNQHRVERRVSETVTVLGRSETFGC